MADVVSIAVKGLGWSIKTFSRSSAATPVLIFYLLFGFFAKIMGAIELWISITPWFAGVFLFLLIFFPNKLRSEHYNLEEKRMQLGEKNKLLPKAEEEVVYQPMESASKRIGGRKTQ